MSSTPFSIIQPPSPRACRYTSDETPMGQYASIHDVLDARRQEALKGKAEGPRTFVVGPTGGWVGVGGGGGGGWGGGVQAGSLHVRLVMVNRGGLYRFARGRGSPAVHPAWAGGARRRACRAGSVQEGSGAVQEGRLPAACPTARRDHDTLLTSGASHPGHPPAAATPQTSARAASARSCSTMLCAAAGRPPLLTSTSGRAASPSQAASPPRQVR